MHLCLEFGRLASWSPSLRATASWCSSLCLVSEQRISAWIPSNASLPGDQAMRLYMVSVQRISVCPGNQSLPGVQATCRCVVSGQRVSARYSSNTFLPDIQAMRHRLVSRPCVSACCPGISSHPNLRATRLLASEIVIFA
jgi:hypothetical protein